MKILKYISLIAGSVSALVAIIGLTLSLLRINDDFKQTRIKKWQAVVVYSIVEQETVGGAGTSITFDRIRSRYLESAQQFTEQELPKSAISDESLQWVLLDLLSSRTIVSLPGRSYRIGYEPFMMRDPNPEIQSELQKVSEKVVYHARTDPNRYTVEQLAAKIAPEFPRTTVDQIVMVINQGFGMGAIYLDKDQRITSIKP